jgi:hypothetical protein
LSRARRDVVGDGIGAAKGSAELAGTMQARNPLAAAEAAALHLDGDAAVLIR